MTGRWRARLAGLLAAVILAACIDITVDGDSVGSIELAQFPWPAIEGGDSLRDTSGVAVPITVRVFRADGTADSATPVTIIAFDTLLGPVSASRHVVAKALNFKAAPSYTANLSATTGSVQSIRRTINVVATPRLITVTSPARRDTINYTLPPAATDTSMALALRVRGIIGNDTVAVPSWPVRFTLRTFAGQALVATDTTQSFFLLGESRASAVDTTDVSGNVSRRLRFRIRPGQATVDSIRVLAKVGRTSRIVPGDTVSWVVLVRPK